jgi:DNA-binding XRE family transcriptional regulator
LYCAQYCIAHSKKIFQIAVDRFISTIIKSTYEELMEGIEMTVSDRPFARRLKELRTGARLSQAALGFASGLSVMTISAYERGVAVPRLDNARALARALKVDLNALAEPGRSRSAS